MREEIAQDIRTILQDEVIAYSCRGTAGWRRVAFLNMSDSSQQCPDSWQLITSPKRTCGRSTYTGQSCDSVTFSINNTAYNQVCGRAIGYEFGGTQTFSGYHRNSSANITLEGQYVDGLSVTHGPPGSREHIWTFAAGIEEIQTTYAYICPCIGGPYAPPFIGNDYFCESGTYLVNTFLADDPLWDGQGCPAGNDCCSFSNPPWFTRQLDNPTNDDIEVRLCVNNVFLENTPIGIIDVYSKDVPIELIELYVK